MLEELSLTKAVEYAIAITHHNALFHSEIARRFENEKKLRKVFLMCATDENIHELNLKRLRDIVPGGLTPNKNRREKMFLLKVMSHSDFLTDESRLMGKLQSIKTKKDALDVAVQLEKDSLNFHLAMKEALGGYEILSSIIRDEKTHLTELMECLISTTDNSSQAEQTYP